MEIVELNADGTGLCDLDGTRHAVDFTLIEQPRAGDFVIVHAGYAIEKLDVREANERLALFDELAALSP
jgi:hydrogenase expression/formation protein HypC